MNFLTYIYTSFPITRWWHDDARRQKQATGRACWLKRPGNVSALETRPTKPNPLPPVFRTRGQAPAHTPRHRRYKYFAFFFFFGQVDGPDPMYSTICSTVLRRHTDGL